MLDLEANTERILEVRNRIPENRCALVAITGIDASGKGYLASKLAEVLCQAGLRIANINIDGWLNLPDIRFSETNPAENFYLNAIRFEDMSPN